MATQDPPKLVPLPTDAFPEEVVVPLTLRRVTSGFNPSDGLLGTAVGTYALNNPRMSAALAITLGIPKNSYDGLINQGEDGRRVVTELIANESGNRICELVDRGSRAVQAPPQEQWRPGFTAGPEHGATAPKAIEGTTGRSFGVATLSSPSITVREANTDDAHKESDARWAFSGGGFFMIEADGEPVAMTRMQGWSERICGALRSSLSEAEPIHASRIAVRFPAFEGGGRPTKAVVEIDATGPDSLQVMLRKIQGWAYPSSVVVHAAEQAHRTGGGILADAGHFRSDQPMVGAARGEQEREASAIAGASFIVDQTGIKTFDVLRVNRTADPPYRIVAQCQTKEDASTIATALSIAYGSNLSEAEWLDEHATQFFAFEQFPPMLQDVARVFHALARKVVAMVPRNQQRTMALNKLVEAKDCAVRAMVANTVEERKRVASTKGGVK